MASRLIDSLATTDALAEVFSDRSLLQAMLDFEVALARAEVTAGVIPERAAGAIAVAARAEHFDAEAIASEARESGTISIPLVQALTARVQAADAASARFVHFGATSQDVADSAMVLTLRRAHAILAADHRRLATTLRRVVRSSRTDGDARADAAAARAAGHVRSQGRGLGRRARARLEASRGRDDRRGRAAVWRRRGHTRRARRSRAGRVRRARRRARARCSRCPVAHPPRSARRARGGDGDLHRHARQDRARHHAPDAGRSRRGRRARRRFVHDAAQAQPRVLRPACSRRRRACPASWRRF